MAHIKDSQQQISLSTTVNPPFSSRSIKTLGSQTSETPSTGNSDQSCTAKR